MELGFELLCSVCTSFLLGYLVTIIVLLILSFSSSSSCLSDDHDRDCEMKSRVERLRKVWSSENMKKRVKLDDPDEKVGDFPSIRGDFLKELKVKACVGEEEEGKDEKRVKFDDPDEKVADFPSFKGDFLKELKVKAGVGQEEEGKDEKRVKFDDPDEKVADFLSFKGDFLKELKVNACVGEEEGKDEKRVKLDDPDEKVFDFPSFKGEVKSDFIKKLKSMSCDREEEGKDGILGGEEERDHVCDDVGVDFGGHKVVVDVMKECLSNLRMVIADQVDNEGDQSQDVLCSDQNVEFDQREKEPQEGIVDHEEEESVGFGGDRESYDIGLVVDDRMEVSKSSRNESEGEGMLSDEEEWEGIERSELEKEFDRARSFVELGVKEGKLQTTGDDLMMQFYGLQKVALEGPCHEPQPMALKLTARAKWNTWQRLGNMSPEEAMDQYIALLSSYAPEWKEDQSSVDRKSNSSQEEVDHLPDAGISKSVAHQSIRATDRSESSDPTDVATSVNQDKE